jgi:hypothetical protein
LSAGPWIAELLENLNMVLPPSPRNPTATGIFAFPLKLNPDQTAFFKGKPALSYIGYGIALMKMIGNKSNLTILQQNFFPLQKMTGSLKSPLSILSPISQRIYKCHALPTSRKAHY